MEKENSEKLSFHLHLIAETGVLDKYPFRKLLIERDINEQEYKRIHALLNRLHHLYLEQKEEGLLDYTSLLLEYVGMLPEKLDYLETLHAIKEEGGDPSYVELIRELIRLDREYRY